MAASDKPFRNQYSLDMVFAICNILMLLSIVWMLWQDYSREYKTELRAFREIEAAVAQRQALREIPSEEEFAAAEAKVIEKSKFRDENKDSLNKARAALIDLRPKKERAEADYQNAKADVESITSFRNIALEHGTSESLELAKKYDDDLVKLNEKLATEQAKRDQITSEMKLEQLKIDRVEGELNQAVAAFKKINDRFDSQVKLAMNKQWGFGDWLRSQFLINGFADPLKVQQFTINDIPIDYNFKYVTRFDRCMSCHIGIDRPGLNQASLKALTEDADQTRLDAAIKMYDRRIKALDAKDAATIPDPHKLVLAKLSKELLTSERITEFSGHPRLDLFVGSNSKHPAEKFGCTSCHAGQGSGTSFLDSSHSPNNSKTRSDWTHERGWAFNHDWDFPMLPARFTESSCLKCHHEVTDLISTDNRVEAPKLLQGYSLIRENGCFGCHEISGWKGGQRVGPDLRLEPSPPFEDLTPFERIRVENDPDNRPGTLRKVGPALTRVSEKVNPNWIEKWLLSPSAFRPDTKMPHYYNQSTNKESVLPEDQKKFPNTEIASIAHFLTTASKDYLKQAEKLIKDDAQVRAKDAGLLAELLNKGRLNEQEKKELEDVKVRLRLRKEAPLKDLSPDYAGDPKKGRTLFTERGCLACHTHHGTETPEPSLSTVALKSDAVFGPNLSQLKAKLKDGKADARTWLIQWVMNPQFHSPRSRMPITHLTTAEAADLAAWLLAQPATELGAQWTDEAFKVDPPSEDDLKKLARVYLTRMLSKDDMDKFLDGKLDGDAWTLVKNDIPKDEQDLYPRIKDRDYDALKSYLGKKAVSRLGCYACHDIPGFENAKSIGVGLNDWGKKAPERLAFEDIANFYKQHYYSVDTLAEEKGIKDGKEPYEKFYEDALIGHNPQRDGFLNQKIRDPRSYDFNRKLAWDDRARMPKFNFARPRMQKDEEASAFQARVFKDEAAGREAVATFVLGLTAESVPVKSISTPSGDRLAEVKGRQVLDKYNCNGCHVVRSGSYDFKIGSKTQAKLELASRQQQDLMNKQGEIVFPNHVNWVGQNPLGGDRLTAHGVQPTFFKTVNNDEVEESWLLLRLSEALRFVDDKGAVKNIPSSTQVFIALEDLHPNPASITTQVDIDRYFSSAKPYGGAFSDLLVPYLSGRNPKKYPMSDKDSAEARASLPPTLIGQGERTQADWLYQFLLNPQKIRQLAILRMPKFNMSREEAKTLVDYFAAVTRQNNPGIGLPYPYESTPQRDDLDSPYWRNKTKAYVAHLRASKAMDLDGKVLKAKDGKDMTAFEQRVEEYKPFWEKMLKEQTASLKADLEKLDDLNKARAKDIEAKEKALKTEKGKEADLQKDIDALRQAIKDSADDQTKMESALKKLDMKTLEETWVEKEAYAADAYRMLSSRKLCLQCHQVGSFTASERDKQGPPLALANARLRPNWIVHWVDKPQRFVPYASLMPTYFNDKELKWQPLHSGVALEQIQALRDVLMNYPRLADMPVNRLYNPDMPTDKK